MDLIIHKKRVNGHIFSVEEVWTGRRKLAVVTMWKVRSNKPKEKGSSPALTHTSETDLPRKQARTAAGDDEGHHLPSDADVNKHSRAGVAGVDRYSQTSRFDKSEPSDEGGK